MTLLLHTSSPTIRLGLADGQRLVARQEFPAARDLAAVLADRIREFLETHRSKLAALQAIAVHQGPGGFTVLRIGVTTANALAYALGISVVGVAGNAPDLETLLEKSLATAPTPSGTVVPVYRKPPDIGSVPLVIPP